MRLIDAERLDVVTGNVPDGMDSKSFVEGGFAMFQKIHDAPTVDAVAVVRCEQCKYAMPLVYGETEHIVSPNGDVMCGKSGAIGRFVHDWHKSDWFCADGKRKDDADT